MIKRYILTGTPGAGKTVLLRSLERRGHTVVEEAATDLILRAQAQGIVEPWVDPAFIDDVVALQRQRQEQAPAAPGGVLFFDRSPICSWALAAMVGHLPSPALIAEIERMAREHIYERRVFFIANLGFVTPTAVRRLSFADALRFERLHEEAYDRFGYERVIIAADAPDARCEAVMKALEGR